MPCDHVVGVDQLFEHRCDELPTDVGGVHALVIGTSAYLPAPPLPPQPTAVELARAEIAAFGDIDGAALGAAYFAGFLRDSYRDPAAAPLKSIRLLLEPTDDEAKTLENEGFSWQPASVENVRSALQRWANDCDRGDIGIVYIAGHGIIAPDGASWVYLGECNNTPGPFDAAINVGCVQQALEQRSAYFTVFIFDCCSVHDDRATPSQSAGIGLTLFRNIRKPPNKRQLSISAAPEGAPAYSIPGEGTVLSKALLPLLNSAGRVVQGAGPDDWFFAITQDPLQEGLLNAMRLVKMIQEPCVNGNHPVTGIHRPIEPPTVTVVLVNSDRDHAVEYRLTRSGAPLESPTTVAPQQRIPLEVPAGAYVLSVDSPAGPLPPRTIHVHSSLTITL